MTLELSQETVQIICEFAEEVGRKIDELGFEIDARRRTEMISDIKIYFHFHCIKIAGKMGVYGDSTTLHCSKSEREQAINHISRGMQNL